MADLTASPALRALRAVLLGAVIMTVGSVAHVSADGRLPGAVGLGVLLALVVAGCAAFLGREASAMRLVALTVGGQTLLHTALAAVAGHAGDRPGQAAASLVVSPASTGQPLNLYDQFTAGSMRPVQAPASFGVPDWLVHGVADIASHPGMALAHVAAAAAVALWLAVGERSLWSLIRLARASVEEVVARLAVMARVQVVVLLGMDRTVPVRAGALLARPALPVWSRGPVRRGPPLALLAR